MHKFCFVLFVSKFPLEVCVGGACVIVPISVPGRLDKPGWAIDGYLAYAELAMFAAGCYVRSAS